MLDKKYNGYRKIFFFFFFGWMIFITVLRMHVVNANKFYIIVHIYVLLMGLRDFSNNYYCFSRKQREKCYFFFKLAISWIRPDVQIEWLEKHTTEDNVCRVIIITLKLYNCLGW